MLFENEFRPPDEFPRNPKVKRSDESDAIWLEAIQAVAPILHYDEREKYQSEIASNLTLSQKLAAWRGRKSAT